MNVPVHFSPVISNSCRSYILGFVRGESSRIKQWGGAVKTPPANTKYVNCYNLWWYCPILIYLVYLDLQWRNTSYINVYVSHKTTNDVRNGAFSQKVWVCSNIFIHSFQIDVNCLNMRTSLKQGSIEQFESKGKTFRYKMKRGESRPPHRLLYA